MIEPAGTSRASGWRAPAFSVRVCGARISSPAAMALMALSASAALTVALWLGTNADYPDSPGFRLAGDDHVYIYMATHGLGSFRVAPWCWRILVPFSVHLLPLTVEQGFACITLVTTALTGFTVYLICRKLNFGFSLSMLGLILFYALSYATRFNIRDFWLTDTTAFMFSAFAVLAILGRRRAGFLACLALGVLAKESVIFVAPLYYTLIARSKWDRSAFFWTVLLAVPSVIELAVLRRAIPAWNGHHVYILTLPANVRSDLGNVSSYNLLAVAKLELDARWHIWPQELIQIITSFGTLGLILPLLAGRQNLRMILARFWPFLVLVYSQLLFTFNTQRLLVLAFIPMILAALLGVRRAADHFKVPAWTFWVAACAAVAMELTSRTASAPSPGLQLGVFGILFIITLAFMKFSRSNGQDLTGGFPDAAGRVQEQILAWPSIKHSSRMPRPHAQAEARPAERA